MSDGDKVYKNLTKLFQICINKQNITVDWKVSNLTTIFKKGDKTVCDNYRGIAVTCTFSRVYGRIIKIRVDKGYKDMEAEEQKGFRTERSTIGQLFTITQVIRKRKPMIKTCNYYLSILKNPMTVHYSISYGNR